MQKNRPLGRYSNSTLLYDRILELEEDLQRKDRVISEQLGKQSTTSRELSRTKKKIIEVKRKKKGTLDAQSKKHIANEAFHTIIQNLLSLPIAVVGSMGSGEYTHWIPIMGLTNAIFGPMTMAVQKLKEEH